MTRQSKSHNVQIHFNSQYRQEDYKGVAIQPLSKLSQTTITRKQHDQAPTWAIVSAVTVASRARTAGLHTLIPRICNTQPILTHAASAFMRHDAEQIQMLPCE